MFESSTYGTISLAEVRVCILRFLREEPDRAYQIVIGSDSQPQNGSGVDFVTAIVVMRLGTGGIYFWRRMHDPQPYVLRNRMYREATLSLEMAEELSEVLTPDGINKYDLEIHVDIGPKGKTRDMIAEIVGMVRGSGYAVRTKPESFGASSVADRHA